MSRSRLAGNDGAAHRKYEGSPSLAAFRLPLTLLCDVEISKIRFVTAAAIKP